MIRHATEDDIPRLVALKKRIASETYGTLGDEKQLQSWLSRKCSVEYFEGLFEKQALILMAEYETATLGIASVTFGDNDAYLGDLYIGTELQQRGFGSQLTQHRFQYVQNHFSMANLDTEYTIRSNCFYSNYRAYQHLLKHGFKPVDFYMEPSFEIPVVRMSQVLTVAGT